MGEGSALLVRLKPFYEDEGPNLAWIAPTGKQIGDALVLHPPRTVEGYHWSWTYDVSLPVWIDERAVDLDMDSTQLDEWAYLGEFSVGDLSQSEFAGRIRAARAIAFRVSESEPPLFKRWPAVVGRGNAHAASISLVSLSPVTPLAPQSELILQIQGEDLEMTSRSESCGTLCLKFHNALEAMDSPFVIRKQTAQSFNETDPSGLRMVAFTRKVPEDSASKLDEESVEPCLDTWRQTLSKVGDLFEFLKTAWGTPSVVSSGYDVYLTHQVTGSDFQGLEHSSSTLLALSGQCSSDAYASALSGLMAHELVHIWNVKHLFPAEHASFSLENFNSERTKQLYLYEGWTEGFALMGLAQTGALSAERTLNAWNAKLSALYSAFSKTDNSDALVLNIADPSNAFGQYNTGASYLLYLALRLSNENNSGRAKTLFWSLFNELRAKVDNGKETSSLDAPAWRWRTWTGLTTILPSGRPQGYTSQDVISMLQERIGTIPGTASGQVGLTSQAFEDVLSAYVARSGMTLNRSATGAWSLAEGNANLEGQLPWPFGPREL